MCDSWVLHVGIFQSQIEAVFYTAFVFNSIYSKGRKQKIVT